MKIIFLLVFFGLQKCETEAKMFRYMVLIVVLIILLEDVNAIFNISSYWRTYLGNRNHENDNKVNGYFEKHLHVHGRPPIQPNKHHYLGKHYVVNEHHDYHQERNPHYAHRYAPGSQQNGHHHEHAYLEVHEPHHDIHASVPQQPHEQYVPIPHYVHDESNRPIVIDDVIYEVPPYEPIRTIDDSFAELTGISTENPDIFGFVQNKPQPEVVHNNQATIETNDESHHHPHHQHHHHHHHDQHEVESTPPTKPEYHNIHKTIKNELKNIDDSINLSGADEALEIIVDISPFSHKPRFHVKGHEHHDHHHKHHHEDPHHEGLHDHHDHHEKHHHHHKDHHHEHHHSNDHHDDERHHSDHHHHHHKHPHDHHYKHHSYSHPKTHYHKPTHHNYNHHENKHYYHHTPTHHPKIFQKGKSFSEAYFRQWHK